MMRHLAEEDFDSGLKNEFLAEARRRNLTTRLRESGFQWWRN